MNENYELNLNEEFESVELTQEDIEMNESEIPTGLSTFDQEEENGLSTVVAMLIGAGITIGGAVLVKKVGPVVAKKFRALKKKYKAGKNPDNVIDVDFVDVENADAENIPENQTEEDK